MRKINIHLTVDDTTDHYVRLINKGICNVARSAIRFDGNSPAFPHITLTMGYMKEDAEDDEILTVIFSKAMSIGPQRLKILPPFLDKGRNYILSAVEGGDIARIKTDFMDILTPFLDMKSNHSKTPHMTFGCLENNDDIPAVEKFLAQCQNEFMCTGHFIELSDAGPNGTCINSRYKIKLQG